MICVSSPGALDASHFRNWRSLQSLPGLRSYLLAASPPIRSRRRSSRRPMSRRAKGPTRRPGPTPEDRHRRGLSGISAELRLWGARLRGKPAHRRAQRTGAQGRGRESLGRRREDRHCRSLYGLYPKLRRRRACGRCAPARYRAKSQGGGR
jgi:hypothetical protein